MTVKEQIQEVLEGEGYTLKTDEFLIDMICQFGCGHFEFHTADIERLIKENQVLNTLVVDLLLDLGSRVADGEIHIKNASSFCITWKGKHLSI